MLLELGYAHGDPKWMEWTEWTEVIDAETGYVEPFPALKVWKYSSYIKLAC
jgi:hypothetical protein